MSDEDPRLTLEEWRLAAAANGRALVLVEGNRDRDFYEWYLDDMQEKVYIYTVGDVDTPVDKIHASGLTMGARSQLIWLAKNSSPEPDFCLIIDRDCGHDLPPSIPPGLRLTDYPSIESYAFTLKALNKWLKFIAAEAKITARDLLAELRLPLMQLYFLRLDRPGLREPDHSKYYKDSGNGWAIDLEKLGLDYRLSDDAVRRIGALSRAAKGDVRKYVYGHDIAALLDIRLKAIIRNKAQLRTAEAVERTLRMAMEHADLSTEPLFAELRKWLEAMSVSL